MKTNFKHLVCCVLFITLYCASNGSCDQWEPVPEEKYLAILETIALQTKANYEKISTWEGKLDIVDKIDIYGDRCKKYIDPAVESNHIREIATSKTVFAKDLINDKLYCNHEPKVEFIAVDLNQSVPKAPNLAFSRSISIVTPEEFLIYTPDVNFAGSPSIPMSYKGACKRAFRNPPEQAKDRLKADIYEPGHFFTFGGEKTWETISLVIKEVSELGNVTIAGRPHLSIFENKQANSKQYKIVTVWKTGKDIEEYYGLIELVVDSADGFNVRTVKSSIQPGDWRQYSKEMTYEKIGGIFVPKTCHEITIMADNKPSVENKIVFEKSIMNKPIPEETFTYESLGLENGVRFVDNIKTIEYRYENGKLVPESEKIRN